ncbi:MAG: PBP1A family penicillin-binding protein [Candidatus Paceibacterota bacterium]
MKTKNTPFRFWKYIWFFMLAIAVVIVIEVIIVIKDLPHPEKLNTFQPAQSTKVYDRTGTVLLYEIHGDQSRTILDIEKIPLYIKQATIAAEDQTFYEHSALDWKGVIRSIFVDITSGEFSQGGSTITQQLVKNVFLTNEKTIQRKIKEAILAYWLEQQYTKDEILSFYLNQIPYGSNSYGIESASMRYFGIPASSLSIAQAATLAAIPKSPTYYSPWGTHAPELKKRADYIIEEMHALNYITDQEFISAKKETLTFLPQNIGVIKAPHFSLMVKDQLSQLYGDETVEKGGLKVITTLDWKLQEIAERVIRDGVKRNTELYAGTNGSFVAQDPKTGHILALVGSANYFDKTIDGNFNVAAQGLRQPGSTFKPLVYLSAFEKGYTPDTIVFDVPTNFNTNGDPQYNYIPENYDGTFRGPISLKEALAQSINVPAVKTLYLVGLPTALETAYKMGITTLQDPSRYGLSLVLGGGEVKLIDMVGAYSVFAQDGIKHAQSLILDIQNTRGESIYTYKDSAEQIIDPLYPRMINTILSNSSLRSGLFSASLPLTIFDPYAVALKTGTTNDYRDAWTIGYTPSLVAGVWVGNSNNKPMQQKGGSLLAALPIWSAFMKEALTEYQPETFPTYSLGSSDIPMINGQYETMVQKDTNITKQIHSILYYVDKNNPTKRITSPSSDPQFENWEQPVLQWAQQHIPNFNTDYNK